MWGRPFVCFFVEEAGEHEFRRFPVVVLHGRAQAVVCLVEESQLVGAGAAIVGGSEGVNVAAVRADCDCQSVFALAQVAQESTRLVILVGEAVDLGGEREGGAGGHRVLEVAHGAPRVLLELVGGHVVCGRSLSDFVFFVLGEPRVEEGHVDVSVGGDDVLVAASVALYDGEVGGGMVQSVACVGVGVGGGACELGVVNVVGGHGVFSFLRGVFSCACILSRVARLCLHV